MAMVISTKYGNVYAEAYDSLAEDIDKKEPQINVANFILDTPELKVWKRKKEKKLLLRIELDLKMSAGDMQTNLLKKMIEVNKLISSGELKS